MPFYYSTADYMYESRPGIFLGGVGGGGSRQLGTENRVSYTYMIIY